MCADQSGCTANEYGGAGFAASIWAGYMALVNEQAANSGHTTIGFINPYIYPIGLGSNYERVYEQVIWFSTGNYVAMQPR